MMSLPWPKSRTSRTSGGLAKAELLTPTSQPVMFAATCPIGPRQACDRNRLGFQPVVFPPAEAISPVDPPDAWIGIAAIGNTFSETLQALARLGLDSDQAIAAAGIRLLQIRQPGPLPHDVIRRFASGLEEIVIVEKKGTALGRLMKVELYGVPNAPRIVGRKEGAGQPLMVDDGMLDADKIANGLYRRLGPRLGERLAPPPAAESKYRWPGYRW